MALSVEQQIEQLRKQARYRRVISNERKHSFWKEHASLFVNQHCPSTLPEPLDVSRDGDTLRVKWSYLECRIVVEQEVFIDLYDEETNTRRSYNYTMLNYNQGLKHLIALLTTDK
jgi:hypothetical protein